MKALAKHILFIVILLMTTSSLKAQQVLSETEQLFSQFKRAARFDYNFLEEKVHIKSV